MSRLSANFTERELLVSASYPHLVPNNLPIKYRDNAKRLVRNVLQPIRDVWGKALKVLSCYRSLELNKAVHGSPTSQHTTATAADITTADALELFQKLLTGEIKPPTLGQVIYYPLKNFIHIALPSLRYPDAAFFVSTESKKYVRVKNKRDLAKAIKQ